MRVNPVVGGGGGETNITIAVIVGGGLVAVKVGVKVACGVNVTLGVNVIVGVDVGIGVGRFVGGAEIFAGFCAVAATWAACTAVGGKALGAAGGAAVTMVPQVVVPKSIV